MTHVGLGSPAKTNLVNLVNETGRSLDQSAVTQITNSLVCSWQTLMYAEGKSRRTVKDRGYIIRRVERDLATPALSATTAQLAEWLSRPDLAAHTRSVYHSILRSFYGYVVNEGLRPDNPMDGIRAAKRPRRQPRPITVTQFRRLLDNADTPLKAMLLLGGYAGLRVHEIARFHTRQLDMDARTIDVTGKGGSTYVLPAHDAIIRHARRMPRGYWFPSQRGAHVGGRVVSERIAIHMIQQGVRGRAHSLRHMYGTELVANGADLRVAQELLRHSSLQTTAIYVQTSDTRKRDAIDRLPAA